MGNRYRVFRRGFFGAGMAIALSFGGVMAVGGASSASVMPQIAGGGYHTLALKSDGTVWTSSPTGAEAGFDSATGSRINQAAAAKRGGGLWFSWVWSADLADMYNLDIDLSILNDPSTSNVLFFSTQLSCGTTLLKNTFYFGIQTNVQGRGKGCLISRWGTRDLSNCETAGTSDSW